MEATKAVKRETFLGAAQKTPAINWAKQKVRNPRAAGSPPVLEKLTAAVQAVFKPIFSYKVVEFYDCDDANRLPDLPDLPALHAKTFDGSVAVPGELASLAELHPGETLTTIYIGRKEVGYIHAGFKPMLSPDTGVWVNVKPGEVYLYGLTILPEFRGRGFSKYLLVSAANAFHKRGFSRIIVSKLLAQFTSQSEMEKAGFQRYDLLRAFKIFSKRIHVIY